MNLEKPGKKLTKGTKSAIHFTCFISSLTLYSLHWAMKVITIKKEKLFIKQGP